MAESADTRPADAGVGSPRRPAPSGRVAAAVAACVLAVAATVVAILLVHGYEDGHRMSAVRATAAELDATRLDALEWRAIALGQPPPGAQAEVDSLLRSIHGNLDGLPDHGDARGELAAYAAAIQAEFELLSQGNVAQAWTVDEQRVDPTYRQLSAALDRAARDYSSSADAASSLGTIVEAAIAGGGIVFVVLLFARFVAARRALVAAEIEQRLLRESERAKSELLSVVSHDLRTPLTSMIGYLDVVAEEEAGPLTDEQRRFLGIAKRNAERLLALANDLLFVFRAQAGRTELALEELHLERVASEAVEAQLPAARAREIDLRVTTRDCPPVLGDRHRIDELLENLLSNALKFTAPGGTVAVSVAPRDDRVRLEVSDTGVGIGAEEQELLFEPFFRTASAAQVPGAGLGLAIVKAVAEAHDARLGVQSVPGAGTTISVDFPRVSVEAPRLEGAAAAAAAPSARSD